MKTKFIKLTEVTKNYGMEKTIAILELMENVGIQFQFDKSTEIITIFASAENFSFDNLIQILEMTNEVEMWD